MRVEELARYLSLLEKTASRNAMTEVLSDLFDKALDDEIAIICYLALGRLSPMYNRLEFNLAEKMVVRAVANAFSQDVAEVWSRYKLVGDMGGVAKELAGNQPGGQLEVKELYQRLVKIAKEGGMGSQQRKVEGLAALLNDLESESVKFVVRVVVGKLRLGFSDKTILDALSVMETGGKDARASLEKAYQVFPNVGEIAALTKRYGYMGVPDKVSVTLGVPVLPALCQRLKTANEMVEKMGKVMVEPKYDGTRVQIHFKRSGGEDMVRTFTRNLDETTHMFPELKSMQDEVKANSMILDSEAVGVHPETGELLPFQATITRKRKHGIEEASRQVPLKYFVFDVLFVDGKELLETPMYERRKLLEKLVKGSKILEVAPVIVTEKADELRSFHKEQLGRGLEGAVIKKYDGAYVPGRRGWNWVKFKEVEEAQGKLSDTVDGVVMGFYRGRGKRAKFGIGAFLVGVVGSGGEVLSLAKIGTGLTDEQWITIKKKLEEVVSVEKPDDYKVDKQLYPDVWVDPELVVEIAADEITRSPIHAAGVALRFPRLVRVRDDKDKESATTVSELRAIG